jgi:hypothetical protein
LGSQHTTGRIVRQIRIQLPVFANNEDNFVFRELAANVSDCNTYVTVNRRAIVTTMRK